MNIVDALERHREQCSACWSGSVCSVAQELIARLADRLVPRAAPEILNLAAHKKSCAECRDRALCRVGQRIVFDATTALIDAAGEGGRGMGKA